jgi:hypothetical protein
MPAVKKCLVLQLLHKASVCRRFLTVHELAELQLGALHDDRTAGHGGRGVEVRQKHKICMQIWTTCAARLTLSSRVSTMYPSYSRP